MLNILQCTIFKIRSLFREDRRSRYKLLFELIFYCTIILALFLRCYFLIEEYLMQQIRFKELIIKPNGNNFHLQFKLRKYYFFSFRLLNKPTVELICNETGNRFFSQYDFKTEINGKDILYKGILSYKNSNLQLDTNKKIRLRATVRVSVSFFIFKNIFKHRGVPYTYEQDDIFTFLNKQNVQSKVDYFIAQLVDYTVSSDSITAKLNVKLNYMAINIDSLYIDLGNLCTDFILNKSTRYRLVCNNPSIENTLNKIFSVEIQKYENDFDDLFNICSKNLQSITISKLKINRRHFDLIENYTYVLPKQKQLNAHVKIFEINNQTIYATMFNITRFDYADPVRKTYFIYDNDGNIVCEINMAIYFTYVNSPQFYISTNITITNVDYFIYVFFNKSSFLIEICPDFNLIYSLHCYDFWFLSGNKQIKQVYEFNNKGYENIDLNFNITRGTDIDQYDLHMKCHKKVEERAYITIEFDNLTGIVENRYILADIKLNGTVLLCADNKAFDLVLTSMIRFKKYHFCNKNILTDLLQFNIFSREINLLDLKTGSAISISIFTKLFRLMGVHLSIGDNRLNVNIEKAFPFDKYLIKLNFKTDLQLQLQFLNFIFTTKPENFTIYFKNSDIVIDGLEISVEQAPILESTYDLLVLPLKNVRMSLPYFIANLINNFIMRGLSVSDIYSFSEYNFNLDSKIDLLLNLNTYNADRFTGYIQINRQFEKNYNFNNKILFTQEYIRTADRKKYKKFHELYTFNKNRKYMILNKLYATYCPYIAGTIKKMKIYCKHKLLGEIFFAKDQLFYHINIQELNITDYTGLHIVLREKGRKIKFNIPFHVKYERKTVKGDIVNIQTEYKSDNPVIVSLYRTYRNPLICQIPPVLYNFPLFGILSYALTKYYANNISITCAYNNRRCCSINFTENSHLLTSVRFTMSDFFIDSLENHFCEVVKYWEKLTVKNLFAKIVLRYSVLNYATFINKIMKLFQKYISSESTEPTEITYSFMRGEYILFTYKLPFTIRNQLTDNLLYRIILSNYTITASVIDDHLNLKFTYEQLKNANTNIVIYETPVNKYTKKLGVVYSLVDTILGNLFVKYNSYMNLFKFLSEYFNLRFVRN